MRGPRRPRLLRRVVAGAGIAGIEFGKGSVSVQRADGSTQRVGIQVLRSIRNGASDDHVWLLTAS
jgi:hypothetical protein